MVSQSWETILFLSACSLFCFYWNHPKSFPIMSTFQAKSRRMKTLRTTNLLILKPPIGSWTHSIIDSSVWSQKLQRRLDTVVWAATWRRQWQPTLVLLPGESQGQRSLVGCCLWGPTESDTTEATQQQQQQQFPYRTSQGSARSKEPTCKCKRHKRCV